MRRVHVIFDHPSYVAKTKALISFVVTAKLICVFVFAYAKRWISHDAAHVMTSVISFIFVMALEKIFR